MRITNSTGGVIYESNYEPFGPSSSETSSEDYRYTGKHEDPSGLYYYGARYYDPLVGRFTTRDTVFGNLDDPQSLNRYVYCTNNPHKYTDPDGRTPLWAIGAVVGGGMNLGYYYLKHRDGDFNWNEALATTAAGAVSGAITGGTLGLYSAGGALAGSTVAQQIITSNVIGTFVSQPLETVTELIVMDTLETDSSMHETIGSGLLGGSLGIIGTGVDLVKSADELNNAVPTPRASTLIGGMVASKLVGWAIEDRWWEYLKYSSVDPSSVPCEEALR